MKRGREGYLDFFGTSLEAMDRHGGSGSEFVVFFTLLLRGGRGCHFPCFIRASHGRAGKQLGVVFQRM
jgi:hypothetical protein